MANNDFQSFSQFWPFYLGEHINGLNRNLHLMGTSMVIIAAIVFSVLQMWTALLLVPFLGYGPAWIGHIFFEKNRPATFKHPFYSLIADFYMWSLFVTGRLGKEIKKLKPTE